jgi:maltose/moltooligosaccharide transporter
MVLIVHLKQYTIMKKPKLSFWQIWNLSFGFLGVQIGYSLQNGNTSRILEALGADVHSIGYFWLAAPLAGLIVQPIIGLSSDKTWTRLGRRIPFIFFGAIVSALAMFFMPNAEYFTYLLPPLIFGAVMLLLMDTSCNPSELWLAIWSMMNKKTLAILCKVP